MNTQTSSTETSQTATPETGIAYDEAALVALARDLTISDEEQERLAAIGSPSVREALAANPCLNELQQRYLAATGSLEVKCTLAKNPSLVDALQQVFAECGISEIREALAENHKLNPACQFLLMQEKAELRNRLVYTLMPLASNPALTKDLQQALATSGERLVVASLAKNPSISVTLMEQLAGCGDEEVCAGLASNTKLPELMQAQLIASGYSKVLENIARNPSLRVAQQALLAHEGSVDVRLALLENSGIDAHIKAMVNSSFTADELNWAERELERAECQAARLMNEHHDAVEKCIKAHGGFFSASDEKIERLNNAADRIQERIFEAEGEIARLNLKVRKLQGLTKNQPAAKNGYSLLAVSA